MNRLQREILAIKESAKIYLRYRRKPLEYYNFWRFEKINSLHKKWENEWRDKITPFKNKYVGEDCFIIGNGPSLNKTDLSKLNSYYTFGLNKIFLIFNRVNLEIDFLVSVNPYVIEQSISEFNALKVPKFLSYLASKDVSEFDANTYKIYTTGGLECEPDLTRPIREGFTVTNVALQIAYYLGFQNVFLVGVDHNFQQKGKPNETQKMEDDDVNHFDPNYFKGMNWQLADLEGSELAYRNTKFVYDRSKRKIWDATVDGKLQVFEKITYEEALQQAKKKSIT